MAPNTRARAPDAATRPAPLVVEVLDAPAAEPLPVREPVALVFEPDAPDAWLLPVTDAAEPDADAVAEPP